MIYRRNIVNTDHLLCGDVTEHGDFSFCGRLKWLLNYQTACNLCAGINKGLPEAISLAYQVRQETQTAQGVDSCLSWLRLLLPMHIRYERYMDQSKIIVTDAELELPHGLYEGCRLDVTDGSTELGNASASRALAITTQHTSTIQTSGSSPVLSTGIFATRSIQS